ncbi:MAG TPA: hypothetical protein VMA77_24355 [Solirubrobacteraceae bacterium]|nr:hypothetical protein [Solirubrobacteraceae bacterium]
MTAGAIVARVEQAVAENPAFVDGRAASGELPGWGPGESPFTAGTAASGGLSV